MPDRAPALASPVPLPPGAPALAVAATFTADPLGPALTAWLEESALGHLAPTFAPYDQVHQHVLDPRGLFATNRDGVNVVLFRFQDGYRAGEERQAEERLQALEVALDAYEAAAPLLVVRCPDAPDLEANGARRERRLMAACDPDRGIYGVRAAELRALLPAHACHSPHGERVGHVPYTEAFFVALAAVVARRVAALRSSPYKAIAVDCDGTLWDGVCAEVGPRGVGLPPPFLEFQRFLVAQAERGVALCLCSKNEADDVWEVFRHRPEMPLQRDHVAAVRIGWGRKSEALRALADELNLGLDAFVFLDDNPAERAEVRAHAPEVLTLELPPSPERRPSFLAGTWAFDRPVTTDADRRRGGFYREEGHRRRAREAAPSFQAFLDGLGLEVEVEPATGHDLVRVEQLMQRTNQFNTTGLRLPLGELRSWAREAGRWVHVVHARDRFGDYGLVGATLSERRGDDLHVPALMLSCRALGRGVEHRLLNALGAHAERVGADVLELAFVPLARNTPAHVFLQATARVRAADAFALSADEAQGVRFTAFPSASTEPSAPVASVLQGGSDEAGNGRTGNGRARIDRAEEAQRLARLAMLWEDPLRVVDEGLAHARRPDTMGPMEPPRTETERVLAGFWADVLRLREVGRSDDFFELGGDSISGTMLLGRVYDAFQVELTLPALFEAPTVAGLAHTISVHEVAHIDADELARELEALRGLTDAEVQALLAAE